MTAPAPVRIGIDATGWGDRRGFGRFTRNVVTELVAIHDAGACMLFADDRTATTETFPAGAVLRRVRLKRPVAGAGGARSALDIARLSYAARTSPLDVFLFPSLLTYVPVLGMSTVVGLHDTSPEALPELTLPSRAARLLWKAKQGMAMRRAARLFTVSEAAKGDLVAHFRLDPAALVVIPEAPEAVFYPREEDERLRARVTVGLRPDEPYLLHAGGMSPHKNLGTLVSAFAGLPKPRPKLMLVGDTEAGSYPNDVQRLREQVRQLGLEGEVVLPGFIPDGTLAALYSDALAVVVPSRAEGFGLSAVEAAACGTPVVLSDLGPHRESLRDAALYFPATDVAALREALQRVLTDEPLRRSLSEEARQAVAHLSWTASAGRLRQLLIDAARSGRDG